VPRTYHLPFKIRAVIFSQTEGHQLHDKTGNVESYTRYIRCQIKYVGLMYNTSIADSKESIVG
jgi:hypothetical protein